MPDEERTPSRRTRPIDLAAATKLIAESGVFNTKYYHRTAGHIADITPIEHYLLHGWRDGLEPSAYFEGRWLYQYFASAGLHEPPALTYATLRAAGEPVFANRKLAERAAQSIRSSDLFDADFYAARVGNIKGLDPVLHYIIIGERLGYAPSLKFDPSYYLKRYPNVRARPVCLLKHYLTNGRAQGRRALSIASELTFDRSRLDPGRETILLVCHKAAPTAAPTLVYNIAKQLHARYNVVALVLLDGESFAEFETCSDAMIGPVTTGSLWASIDGVNSVEGEYIAKKLKANFHIKYAIANGIDTRTMLKPLMGEMIPTVTLIHELPAEVRHRDQPAGEMGRWLEWTNQIVFSSKIVAASVQDEYPHLEERPNQILPPGDYELPLRDAPVEQSMDLNQYVDSLDQLGRKAEGSMRQRAEDFDTISRDNSFDMFMFLDPRSNETTRDDAIRLFLARSDAIATSTQPTLYFYLRRPCPGFHPQIYIHENAGNYDTKSINPLAHFIRSGKPTGPWLHDVIASTEADEGKPALTNLLRVALHGHFYYPELVHDFLEKLAVNSVECDLLLSTSDERKARQLDLATKSYTRGRVLIRVLPNRGRDIGAFLTGFPLEIADYDIIGHLHAKRSMHHSDRVIGEKWREFLWQNLLGGIHPMMDIVLDKFSRDTDLGLVFADDPHLSNWDLNREIAKDIAKDMGLTAPLPPYFDFPLGTMFWARTNALKPLFQLGLGWDAYPVEPAPLDGSVLHAVERLLPFAARQAGYRYATTYIPGMTW